MSGPQTDRLTPQGQVVGRSDHPRAHSTVFGHRSWANLKINNPLERTPLPEGCARGGWKGRYVGIVRNGRSRRGLLGKDVVVGRTCCAKHLATCRWYIQFLPKIKRVVISQLYPTDFVRRQDSESAQCLFYAPFLK